MSPAAHHVALLTGAATAIGAIALALAGRHLVGSSLDLMAGTFAGSQVGLDPLARLMGEEHLRPVTRTTVSAFGTGVRRCLSNQVTRSGSSSRGKKCPPAIACVRSCSR